MVVHAFNPRTREAEVGGSLSLRPAWSTRVSSRTGTKATQRNPDLKNGKTKQNKTKIKTESQESVSNSGWSFWRLKCFFFLFQTENKRHKWPTLCHGGGVCVCPVRGYVCVCAYKCAQVYTHFNSNSTVGGIETSNWTDTLQFSKTSFHSSSPKLLRGCASTRTARAYGAPEGPKRVGQALKKSNALSSLETRNSVSLLSCSW